MRWVQDRDFLKDIGTNIRPVINRGVILLPDVPAAVKASGLILLNQVKEGVKTSDCKVATVVAVRDGSALSRGDRVVLGSYYGKKIFGGPMILVSEDQIDAVVSSDAQDVEI